MTSELIFDVYSVDPPGDSTTFLATLTDAYAKSYRPELNGTGAGQFTIARTSAHATAAIMARGNLVKVRTPVQVAPSGSFFLETGDFTLISSNEEGGEDLRFGGRGGLGYWDRAIWLSEIFTQPWWPDCLTAGPSAGARGAVVVQAGRYRAYTIVGGVITTFTEFRTSGFCASFDTRQTYVWPGANPDGSNSKRFLVHLLDGPQTGIYFHPHHQSGVEEFLASKAVPGTIRSSIPLGEVGTTPGAVLKFLYDEGVAADRPAHPIPLMTVDFDGTTDSNGDPWTTTDALAGLTASPGDTYLSTIGTLIGTGVIDVVMGPDLDMHAYNHYGRDLSGSFGAGKVRFQRGVNIAEQLQLQIADRVVGTYAQVAGSDDTYGSAELPDAASRIAREVSVSGDSTDLTVLEAIGLAELNLRLRRREAISFPIAVGDDEVSGLYTPGPSGSTGHFWIGDTVTVDTGPAEPDFDAVEARIIAVGLEEDEAGGLIAKPDIRTGPLADVGSLGTLTTPDALTAGDSVGECGCPPFHAPDHADVHYYAGTITDTVGISGGSDIPTLAATNAVIVHDTGYNYSVDVTDLGTSGSGFAVFRITDYVDGTIVYVNLFPLAPGVVTGSFSIGSDVESGFIVASLNVIHNDTSTQTATVEFFVDPDGWDTSGGGSPFPEYGQVVEGDTLIETVDGSETVFTLVLGQVAGYRTESLRVLVNGVDRTAYITETDPAGGTFTFDNPPRLGAEITIFYQAATP